MRTDLSAKEAWLSARFRGENAVRSAEKLAAWCQGNQPGRKFFLDLARRYRERAPTESADEVALELLVRDARQMPGFPGDAAVGSFLRRSMFVNYDGRVIPRIHRIGAPEQFARENRSESGFQLEEPHVGFGAVAATVARGAPHSLHNLNLYIFDRFPKAVLEDCLNENREIEFVSEEVSVARAAFRNRGYTVVREIQTISAKSHMVLDLIYDPVRHDARYLVSGIRGRERRDHLLTMLWLADIAGRRIPSRLVRVHDGALSSESASLVAFQSALAKSGALPRTIIINYQKGLTTELVRRALARRKAAGLVSRLGPAPVAAIRNRLEHTPGLAPPVLLRLVAEIASHEALDRGVSRPGPMIFRDPTFVALLESLERLLVLCRDAHGVSWIDSILDGRALPGASSLVVSESTLGSKVWGDGLDRSTFTYVDGAGRRRRAVHFRCVWGADNVRSMARAMTASLSTSPSSRTPTVLVLGTCGALRSDGRVGDVLLPSRLHEWVDGTTTSCEPNVLRQQLLTMSSHLGPRTAQGFRQGGTSVRVPSPLVETREFLALARMKGFDGVDVESTALIRELGASGVPMRVGVGMVATDLPGTALTLEGHGSADQATEAKGVQRLMNLVIESLDIVDVTPVACESPLTQRRDADEN